MAKKGTAKGSGHIFKRGKIFYLQYDVNGKRHVQSLKTQIEKEAKKKAKEILEPAIAADTKEKVMFNVASARKLIHKNQLNYPEYGSYISKLQRGPIRDQKL